MLVAIEGLDGSGKRTLTAALAEGLRDRGVSVGSMAFPRYGSSPEADLIAEALRGAHGDLADSVYGMGVLFALDRARAGQELTRLDAQHDVVLLDRYVASNAAFGAARLHEGADGAYVDWVAATEPVRLGLRTPKLQVLLRVAPDTARDRTQGRAVVDPSRGSDAYERDDGLQSRTAAVYDGLAERGWLSPWEVVDGGGATAEASVTVLDRMTRLGGFSRPGPE